MSRRPASATGPDIASPTAKWRMKISVTLTNPTNNSDHPAWLVLEDGSSFQGTSFGANGEGHGEVVFNTSMTGYQEILTDPSYAGQIVMLTYPLIGNYGINPETVESKKIQVRGLVVREDCDIPSHWNSQSTLAQFLASQGVSGISGVDTRAITRRLRSSGVMMGIITKDDPQSALKKLASLPSYGSVNYVSEVSTPSPYTWNPTDTPTSYNIVALDYGLKYNILRILNKLGCRVTVIPAATSAEDILQKDPDGLLLSPGPGDPALLSQISDTVRALVGVKPIMGICLGNQMLGKAFGGKTFKLKFGHRGANHPVKDLVTGRVHITAQNHGYALDADSLPPSLEVSHLNLNDETVEGLTHRDYPIVSIQYHSEASPGPLDNVYLFQRFLDMVKDQKN